jgi:DNA-binding CsgD family transcriptional regulator
MSKADALRLQDVRSVYRLIGDCRDLGGHPALWYRRMLEGLYVMFGVLQAAGGEGWWDRPSRPLEPISAYSVSGEPGPDEAQRAYHRAGEPGSDPIFQAMQKLPGRLITRTRRQLVPDGAWYGSPAAEYRLKGGIDHALTSVFQVSDDGAVSGIALNRAIGERDFSAREQRLLEFFHAEIGRLIRGPLVSATEPGIEHLPPRLGQTLACLLEGDSEKLVASRLGLSTATVHQYVTALYRRFDVQSRAQLLVHVLKRMPGPQEHRRDGAALAAPVPESPAHLRLVRGGAAPRRRGTV